MTLMLMVFITFLIFLVAYNTLGKDVMSPTFLLVAGYLLSFVSTMYNIKTLFAKFGQLEANHDVYKNRLKNIHSDMMQQASKTTEIVVDFLHEKGVTNA